MTTRSRSRILRAPVVFGVYLITLLLSAQASALQCDYSLDNDWGSGFTASIHITNDSSTAITGWEVSWQQNGGSTISGGWNANLSGSNPIPPPILVGTGI